MTAAFVISHRFDAPRDLVWAVYTQPEHLAQWLGPPGSTMPQHTMDFQVGGFFHYCMRMPNGAELWGKWLFQEIDAPHKLVLIQHFSDPEGRLTLHPMAPTWPRQTLATSTLEADGQETLLTLQWLPHASTPEQMATFQTNHATMNMGWSHNFGVLDRYLAQLQSKPTPA